MNRQTRISDSVNFAEAYYWRTNGPVLTFDTTGASEQSGDSVVATSEQAGWGGIQPLPVRPVEVLPWCGRAGVRCYQPRVFKRDREMAFACSDVLSPTADLTIFRSYAQFGGL